MKTSTISTSILLLLSSALTQSAPISSSSPSPKDCIYGTCSPRLQLTQTPSHHPSVARPHEVVKIEIEITERVQRFDSSFFSPSRITPPSRVLAAHRPFSTNYLQTLSRARQSIEEKVVEYLSKHRSDLSPGAQLHRHGQKPCNKKGGLVYLGSNVYVTTHHYISRKPDVAIVGIVVVFLTFLVLAECIDRALQCLRQGSAQNEGGRGEIFLEEQDGEVRIVGEGVSDIAWEDEKDAMIREVEVEV